MIDSGGVIIDEDTIAIGEYLLTISAVCISL